MANWDWKNDRRLQIAVGLAVVLVVAKWLFTGSLLSDVEVLRGQVSEQVVSDDGSLKSVPVPTSTGAISIAMDFILGILISIGAWILNLGSMLFGKLTSVSSSPAAAESPPVSEDEKTRKLAIALAAAAQSNELDQLEALRIQLRLPMAMDELRDAYQAGDLTAAGTLNTELQTLIAGPKPTTAASKRKAGA